jgi:hypothetical protein
MLSCEIVKLAEPVFVTVKLFELFWPATTLPKLKLAGEIEMAGWTPTPLTGMVSGEPDALLVTVMDPVTFPAAVGANVTDKVAVAEGFSVAGVVIPLTETPVPVAATLEMLTAAVPEFVRTTCFTEFVPVFTFPKLRLLWFDCRFPVGVAVPVPVNGIVNGDPGALLVTVTEPDTAPVAAGANLTDRVAVADAFSVVGADMPLTVKPVPATDTAEI